MNTQIDTIESLAEREYKWGFVTDIGADTVPPGLSEDVIRLISEKKQEPPFMLEWRLRAFRHWQTMTEPTLGRTSTIPPSTIRSIVYYSAPKSKNDGPKSLDEVDPELLKTYEKLGIPIHERELLAGASRWMRFSIACRSRPRLRASWPRSGSSSAPSPKPCASILS